MVATRIAPRFTLWSEHNGLSYILTRISDGADLYFQGDDALEFERKLEAMEMKWPERLTGSILAELWSVFNI